MYIWSLHFFWHVFCKGITSSEIEILIIKYPELEKIHKDHWVQLSASDRITQKSDPKISESIVQIHLELW